jgi:hypothetical protein
MSTSAPWASLAESCHITAEAQVELLTLRTLAEQAEAHLTFAGPRMVSLTAWWWREEVAAVLRTMKRGAGMAGFLRACPASLERTPLLLVEEVRLLLEVPLGTLVIVARSVLVVLLWTTVAGAEAVTTVVVARIMLVEAEARATQVAVRLHPARA